MENFFKAEAIREAKTSIDEGGIPIGAVLVYKNKIIGRGRNRRIQKDRVILHAEMDALENAGRLTPNIYANSVMYTTLSPCAMCSGAIILFGIKKVVIGENVNFVGSEDLLIKNGVTIFTLDHQECINMMARFILEKPETWNEDIGK